MAGIVAGILSIEGHYRRHHWRNWRRYHRPLHIPSVRGVAFPATTVNIVAGGISGLIAGLLVYFLIAPIALSAGQGIRFLIETLVSWSPAIAGLIAGLLIWPAIIGGVYHAAILPIVLLEMETTSNSFLGAVDMVGLVMVSAGITLANIIARVIREKRP